jgi:hypothetical protein
MFLCNNIIELRFHTAAFGRLPLPLSKLACNELNGFIAWASSRQISSIAVLLGVPDRSRPRRIGAPVTPYKYTATRKIPLSALEMMLTMMTAPTPTAAATNPTIEKPSEDRIGKIASDLSLRSTAQLCFLNAQPRERVRTSTADDSPRT